MNKAVAVTTPGQEVLRRAGEWTNEEAAMVKGALASSELSQREMELFGAICNKTGLDPFKKQIYALKLKGPNGPMTAFIAIGGWRAIADSTGQYEGQAGPQWCGADGVWKDVWLDEGPPAAARVGIWRTGFREPLWHVAKWSEFERTKARTGAKGDTPWDEKPTHMLAIRAEGHALQRAFQRAFDDAFDVAKQAGVRVEVADDGEMPTIEKPAQIAAAPERPEPPENVDIETGEYWAEQANTAEAALEEMVDEVLAEVNASTPTGGNAWATPEVFFALVDEVRIASDLTKVQVGRFMLKQYTVDNVWRYCEEHKLGAGDFIQKAYDFTHPAKAAEEAELQS